jgi:hypothetical protein
MEEPVSTQQKSSAGLSSGGEQHVRELLDEFHRDVIGPQLHASLTRFSTASRSTLQAVTKLEADVCHRLDRLELAEPRPAQPHLGVGSSSDNRSGWEVCRTCTNAS